MILHIPVDVLTQMSRLDVNLTGGEPWKSTTENELISFSSGFLQFKMVRVEGGTFVMGATPEQGKNAESEPSHQVTLSSYYIGQVPVTQDLWQAVMGNNPSKFGGDDCPVENVSWGDCQDFVKKLSQMTGKKFRLPTEAEWEYAARGGNKSRNYRYSGSNNLDEVAWYGVRQGFGTCQGAHPVAQKKPNELGIYDMSGNVCEWCQDWYGEYSSYAQTNPQGPHNGTHRVYRGGSWTSGEWVCSVSHRHTHPIVGDEYKGLRLALSEESVENEE